MRRFASFFAAIAVLAAFACGGGSETPGPLPTAVPPPDLDTWEVQAFQIPGTRDLISVPVGWSVAGPDPVGSVSFSDGDSSTYGIVTVVLGDSQGESLDDFSDGLVSERELVREPLAALGVAAADLDGVQAREFRYRYQTPDGDAEVLELHLVDGGRGITVAGEWGPQAAGVVERLVVGAVYSFRPGAAEGPGADVPPVSTVPYLGSVEGRSVQRSVALGSYLALDDSSLWEIAVAERLIVLRWEENDPIRIEVQDERALFPYTLVNDRSGERVPARYVGRGGTS